MLYYFILLRDHNIIFEFALLHPIEMIKDTCSVLLA